MRRACITGGAGFIGSNLADRLLEHGVEVVLIDDLSTGRREFLAAAAARSGVTLIEGDVLDPPTLEEAIDGCDWVFHLQANADLRRGPDHPRRDLEQNTIATSNVLEAMRARGVARILFTSTGSVYGEPGTFPTPEDAPFPLQTSLYGASKVACEALVAAYATAFGFTGVICRLVSVLGERYTHGHVYDFYRALKQDPTRLRVLGDGRQEKSYVYVQDCVSAMLAACASHEADAAATHVYNVGTDETLLVDASVALIAEHLSLSPEIEHAGGCRGWVGDSPLIRLDTTRLRALGWRPCLTIEQALARTLEWFDANEHTWRDAVAEGALS